MELVVPVLPSHAVPSAPCWENLLEIYFGDQERRDTPSTPVCQSSTALRTLGGSRACPGSLLENPALSLGWQHLQTWVRGRKKGLLELCEVQGLAVGWPRRAWQNKVSLCGSGSAPGSARPQTPLVCLPELPPRAGLGVHTLPLLWSWAGHPHPALCSGAGLYVHTQPPALEPGQV